MTTPAAAWDAARELVSRVVERPAAEIPDDGRINRVPGWDSLAQANLMIAVEERTGHRLAPQDAVRLISLEAIARHLAATQRNGGVAQTAPSAHDLSAAVADGLGQTGIGPGDLVLVHSLLAPALAVDGADEVVLEALLAALGEGGTLVLPAFSDEFTRRQVFDRRRTPSQVGRLTECLRTRPGTRISPHPYHRFLAVGAAAEDLTGPHGPSSFGPGSPMARMHELRGKILLLSVDWDTCVFLHYVEERLQVPYRFLKTFDGQVTDGEVSREERWSMYVRDLGSGTRNDFLRFGGEVEAAGLARQAASGPFVFKSVSMDALYDFTARRLKDDPLCLITQPS